VKIVKNKVELQSAVSDLTEQLTNPKIGFVPTMGALHEGHISLISKAKEKCDIVICSIFVNPTQFNNAKDLETYPRTIAEDSLMLEKAACDILLLPDFEDVYPNGIEPYTIDLSGLDEVMEGKFRPGHFKGVCMVVERLLDIVNPSHAFFGQKDFQQVSIIKKMIEIKSIPTEIFVVPIKRDENGLALSSRNKLLTEDQEMQATILFHTLSEGVDSAKKGKDLQSVKNAMLKLFDRGALELEYIEIVDNKTLNPVTELTNECTICIAAYAGNVRLIDNMAISNL
jgi:pantoate--beta-alanine ligase